MAIIKTHDFRRKPKTSQEEQKVEIAPQVPVEIPVEKEQVKIEEPVVNTEVVKTSTPTEDRKEQERQSSSARRSRSRMPKKTTDTRKRPPAQRSRSSSSSESKTPVQRKPDPVIGIICGFEHLPDRNLYSQQYYYLYRPYVSAIADMGGIPIIIPVGIEGKYNRKAFEMIDGLLLAGDASDVDPGRYNDWPQEKLGRVDPRKDRTEIEIFNLAFNKNMPVLGICRGIQVMNVALDGTLYQDIPTQVRMALNHNPKFPPTEKSHRITIEEGTKLHQIIGESDIRVNSSHHQAVKLHGKGLAVNSKASDGITEGIEHPAKKWVIGVQWHPELMYKTDKASELIFKAFVDTCKL